MILGVHRLLLEHITDNTLTQYFEETAVTTATEPTLFPLVATVNLSNAQLHCCPLLQLDPVGEVLDVGHSGHPVEGGGSVVTPEERCTHISTTDNYTKQHINTATHETCVYSI